MSSNSVEIAGSCIGLADTMAKLMLSGIKIEEAQDIIRSAEKELRAAGNELFRVNKIIQTLTEREKE